MLQLIPLSSKSFQVKFKKIVGLTPVKYIKLVRFSNLIKKYQHKDIDIKDLIEMHNYYDQSHFIKDFKFFMKQKPKDFFKKEYPLIKKYTKF